MSGKYKDSTHQTGIIKFYTYTVEWTASHFFCGCSIWSSCFDSWQNQGVEKNEGETAQGNEKKVCNEPHFFDRKCDRVGRTSFRRGRVLGAVENDGHRGFCYVRLLCLIFYDRRIVI